MCCVLSVEPVCLLAAAAAAACLHFHVTIPCRQGACLLSATLVAAAGLRLIAIANLEAVGLPRHGQQLVGCTALQSTAGIGSRKPPAPASAGPALHLKGAERRRLTQAPGSLAGRALCHSIPHGQSQLSRATVCCAAAAGSTAAKGPVVVIDNYDSFTYNLCQVGVCWSQ